ncbi:MAG TPA: hypothetical protein VMF35_09695 [Acidimicrobiales bacterium]|nr:hypothetical protein [Acidimicrobiales bacterium]
MKSFIRGFCASAALTLVVLAGLCGSASAASNEGGSNLSTIVLAQLPIAGYVADPSSALNGPITSSNASLFGSAAATIEEHLTNGDMTGYIRAWTHQPPNGTGVVILATSLSDPAGLPQFLAGFDHGASQAHGTAFSVPQIPNATGYTVRVTTAAGVPMTTHLVDFAKGNVAFVAEVTAQSGALTDSDAINVATAQAAAAPGEPVASRTTSSSTNSVAYEAGRVFVWVVLGAIVVWLISFLIRRNKRRRAGAPSLNRDGATPASTVFAPPVVAFRTPPEVGWHQLGKNPNEQTYWDGQGWTLTRRWTVGRGWSEPDNVDVPAAAAVAPR